MVWDVRRTTVGATAAACVALMVLNVTTSISQATSVETATSGGTTGEAKEDIWWSLGCIECLFSKCGSLLKSAIGHISAV